ARRAAAGGGRAAGSHRPHRRTQGAPVIEIGGDGGAGDGTGAPQVEIPAQPTLPQGLPVLPLRETVPFPDTLTPLAVGQERSIRLVNDALGGSRMLTMVASRSPEVETPAPDDLYDVGVAGTIARMLRAPDGTLRLLVQGGQRVRITRWVRQEPYLLSEILARELEVISLGSKIQSQVQSELDRSQREYFLRQQLKAIQDELGETDEVQAEVDELREQLDAIELPEEVRRQADRELSRLERLPPAAAEHGVIRAYLEWIASLPWDKQTEDNLDLVHAREVLDEDHYDIEAVKDRIVEFLAVRKLNPQARGSILCFVGPPGVGKTSLGRSIARALGRKFERISVGGVRDEAEIRGHRRTYIGAMPGTIIRALRDAGSRNPVFMIDEIDKMGADFRGDPTSAMLEVLDPAQNNTFRDHYLDLPFSLEDVMFITTANALDTVPGPLRDRMEVIQLAGYSAEEKLQIAKRYLVPRQIERNGLRRSQI